MYPQFLVFSNGEENYTPAQIEADKTNALALHILAIAKDVYLCGHPEFLAIVREAAEIINK